MLDAKWEGGGSWHKVFSSKHDLPSESIPLPFLLSVLTSSTFSCAIPGVWQAILWTRSAKWHSEKGSFFLFFFPTEDYFSTSCSSLSGFVIQPISTVLAPWHRQHYEEGATGGEQVRPALDGVATQKNSVPLLSEKDCYLCFYTLHPYTLKIHLHGVNVAWSSSPGGLQRQLNLFHLDIWNLCSFPVSC